MKLLRSLGLVALALMASAAAFADGGANGIIEEIVVTAPYPAHLIIEEIVVTAPKPVNVIEHPLVEVAVELTVDPKIELPL